MCEGCGRTLPELQFRVVVREWNDDRNRFQDVALSQKLVCKACADEIADLIERRCLVP